MMWCEELEEIEKAEADVFERLWILFNMALIIVLLAFTSALWLPVYFYRKLKRRRPPAPEPDRWALHEADKAASDREGRA